MNRRRATRQERPPLPSHEMMAEMPDLDTGEVHPGMRTIIRYPDGGEVRYEYGTPESFTARLEIYEPNKGRWGRVIQRPVFHAMPDDQNYVAKEGRGMSWFSVGDKTNDVMFCWATGHNVYRTPALVLLPAQEINGLIECLLDRGLFLEPYQTQWGVRYKLIKR